MDFATDQGNSSLELQGGIVHDELLFGQNTALVPEKESPQLLQTNPLLRIWVQKAHDNTLENFRVVRVIQQLSGLCSMNLSIEGFVRIIINFFEVIKNSCTEDSSSNRESF